MTSIRTSEESSYLSSISSVQSTIDNEQQMPESLISDVDQTSSTISSTSIVESSTVRWTASSSLLTLIEESSSSSQKEAATLLADISTASTIIYSSTNTHTYSSESTFEISSIDSTSIDSATIDATMTMPLVANRPRLNSDDLIKLLETNTHDFNGCLVNCSNNGVCLLLNGVLKCMCDAFYAGVSCEKNMRPCASVNSPCINNSTCLQTYNQQDSPQRRVDYECECQSELFYGDRCEYKKNNMLCTNETCSMQGNCQEDTGKAVCVCYLYYYGKRCESREEVLNFLAAFIRVATIVAILIIAAFYSLFVLSDITRYLCDKRQQKKSKKLKKRFLIKPIYFN
jgi:hypothetical protein